MRAVLLVVTFAAAGGSPVGGQSAKFDPKHLVGMWCPADAPPDDLTAYLFGEHGRFDFNTTAGGKDVSLRGEYTLNGDRLRVRYVLPDRSEKVEVMTVHVLVEGKLVLSDRTGERRTYGRCGMG